MNLVSRKSLTHAFAIHYADSIFISDFANRYSEDGVLDLGSGAGFPGVVLAVRFPQKKVLLFEKSLKKQGFLSVVVAQLGLRNAEILGSFPKKKNYGFMVARAVFPPEELFEFVSQRMLSGSRVVLNFGSMPKPFRVPPSFQLLETAKYSLPMNQGERQLNLFEFVPRGT